MVLLLLSEFFAMRTLEKTFSLLLIAQHFVVRRWKDWRRVSERGQIPVAAAKYTFDDVARHCFASILILLLLWHSCFSSLLTLLLLLSLHSDTYYPVLFCYFLAMLLTYLPLRSFSLQRPPRDKNPKKMQRCEFNEEQC